jgi:Domain of unknown function (DUF222)
MTISGTVSFADDDSAHFTEPRNDLRTAYARRADTLASMVDEVVEADLKLGIAHARRAQAIERARTYSEAAAHTATSTPSSRDMARRSFVAEIAAALRIPNGTADRLIATSETLVHQLPDTLLALGEGRLGYRHAQILVDNITTLDTDSAKELERRMLPVAQKNTPSRFERTVRRTREKLNPESMTERHTIADTGRAIEVIPENDGMVFIGAHISAVAGIAIDNRLSQIATSLQTGAPDGTPETRTLTQLKADVFVDLLLDADAVNADGTITTTAGQGDGPTIRYRAIRPRVLVTVPALTLLHRDNTPADLEGYGPIDPQTAREIASHSKTLQRLLTDPVTGIVLKMDRRRYRIPKDLRTWLRVRDGTCRFPGCNRAASKSELDHTHEWANGGPTNHTNLAHLCPSHHTLKSTGLWTVKQTGGGTLEWTSQSGTKYITEPEHGAQ